jgi:hypothetical protein
MLLMLDIVVKLLMTESVPDIFGAVCIGQRFSAINRPSRKKFRGTERHRSLRFRFRLPRYLTAARDNPNWTFMLIFQ